jgi:hypothetical protein
VVPPDPGPVRGGGVRAARPPARGVEQLQLLQPVLQALVGALSLTCQPNHDDVSNKGEKGRFSCGLHSLLRLFSRAATRWA